MKSCPGEGSDKMNKYLLCLFEQFNESRRYNRKDFKSNDYIEEFSYWIKLMKKNILIYQYYLQENEIDLNNKYTKELNKGKYDTISLPNTSIISPYGENLRKENSRIYMFQGEPLIINGSSIKREQVVGTYITQNPYGIDNLDFFEYCIENDVDFLLGVFGTITDKDIKTKINRIQRIKSMYDKVSENYETYNGTYIYTIQNRGNVLNKTLKL